MYASEVYTQIKKQDFPGNPLLLLPATSPLEPVSGSYWQCLPQTMPHCSYFLFGAKNINLF